MQFLKLEYLLKFLIQLLNAAILTLTLQVGNSAVISFERLPIIRWFKTSRAKAFLW